MESTASGSVGSEGGMLPTTLKAIVFDFDGTVYSQRRLRWRMALEILAGGLKSPSQLRVLRVLKAYREAHERVRESKLPVSGGKTQLELTAQAASVSEEIARQIVADWFETAPLKFLRRCIRDDFFAVVRGAKKRGIRLGVVSDYPIARKLEATGLTGVFDSVVSSFDEDVDVLKPEPKGLLICLQRLGVAPSENVYVGDRPEVDARCATLAGTPSIIVGGRGFRATALASILEEDIPTTS